MKILVDKTISQLCDNIVEQSNSDLPEIVGIIKEFMFSATLPKNSKHLFSFSCFSLSFPCSFMWYTLLQSLGIQTHDGFDLDVNYKV